MNAPLQIRLMTRADFEFADSLRACAGWNQTLDDWQRLWACEPRGCFVAEWNNLRVGTATTTRYGTDLAWIGMLLVHPEHRRHGIGRALLTRCIDHLQQQNVRCIKLDATPLGRPLYELLGFKEEWTLTRWETNGIRPPIGPRRFRVRPWRSEDKDAICRLDRAAFGADRWPLLQRSTWDIARPLVAESEAARVNAFGMVRRGAKAFYIGPVVATSLATAGPLIKSLLQPLQERSIYWDIPDANTGTVELAKLCGFRPQRPLVRMFLNENTAPGDPLKQFAIAGPEVG